MKIEVKGAIIPNDYAEVYEWFGMDYTSPKKVEDALKENEAEKAEIFINSGGGEIFSAMEIKDALERHKGGCEVHITGLCASAATIISLGGRSDIKPECMFMIHNVSSSCCGDYNDMNHESETLRKATESIASAYSVKNGKTVDEMFELMNKETWLTGREAVEMGLVDELNEPKLELVASVRNPMLPKAVIDKYFENKQKRLELKNKLEKEAIEE